MIANLVVSSVGAFTVKVFNRGTGTQVGSAITASAVGSSTTRWTINLGSLADGQYDLEHGDGYGSWALVVTNGVAAVYASWETYSPPSGSGQYLLTLTAIDTVGSIPLQGALVTIQRAGYNTSWKFTDALGQAVFLVDPATYSVNASLPGYSSVIAQSVVVAANTSASLSLGVLSPTLPPVSGLCLVTFAITDAGVPVEGALIHVELEEPNPMIPNYMVSRLTHDAVTDEDGLAVLTMIQRAAFVGDGVYKIRVSDANGKRLHDRRVTVPAVSFINAVNLTNA